MSQPATITEPSEQLAYIRERRAFYQSDVDSFGKLPLGHPGRIFLGPATQLVQIWADQEKALLVEYPGLRDDCGETT